MEIKDPYENDIVDPFDNKMPDEMAPSHKVVPVTWQGKPIGAVTVEDRPQWKELPGNIPGSAYNYGKGIVKAAIHPKQTAENLGQMMAGGIEKLFPGEQPDEAKFDAFKQDIINSYGSWENFKKTLIEHPVRVMADISSIIVPAGKAVQGVGAATKLERVAAIGSKIADVGSLMEPGAAMREGFFQAAKYATPSARKLYASAAKFSSKLGVEETERLAEVALKNNIMPTIKGYMKADAAQRELAGKVENLISQYETSNPNTKVYLDDLFNGLDQLKQRASLTGNEGLINRLQNKLIKGNMGRVDATGKIALTPSEVQRLKIDLNQENQSYFNQMLSKPISRRAKAQIAKNAKEVLEQMMPEIKQLNASESDMIALRKAIELSAQRIRRRDIMGIGIPIKGGLGAAVAGEPGAALGIAMGMLDTPSVKARLAKLIYKLEKRGVKFSPKSSLFRAALFESNQQMENTGGYETEETKPVHVEKYKHLTEQDVINIFRRQK